MKRQLGPRSSSVSPRKSPLADNARRQGGRPRTKPPVKLFALIFRSARTQREELKAVGSCSAVLRYSVTCSVLLTPTRQHPLHSRVPCSRDLLAFLFACARSFFLFVLHLPYACHFRACQCPCLFLLHVFCPLPEPTFIFHCPCLSPFPSRVIMYNWSHKRHLSSKKSFLTLFPLTSCT